MVDQVVVGSDVELGLDFKSHFLVLKPEILAATEDDRYEKIKRQLCDECKVEYIKLPKTLNFDKIATTEIIELIKAPIEVPLRVDCGGGWLDVPKFSIPGAFIVNCAISPLVSLRQWPYHQGGGLGGSAAYSLLMGKDSIKSELNMGVGWQDPAIIKETGLCVWQSGNTPILAFKRNPDLLKNKMGLIWTGNSHFTPSKTDLSRNYEMIKNAGNIAACGVYNNDLNKIAEGINLSYATQLDEGMQSLPELNGAIAKKYCGGGWGGYALYLFNNRTNNVTPIEPYIVL
jgi:hypothetical protein